ncbi:MAG: DUF4132 domain-containing protein [Myxococcota bacterium]|nr:DUF4132 domain-containing protein [Myxococcota bacterium]
MDFSSRNESLRGDAWPRRSELSPSERRHQEERIRLLLAKWVQALRRASRAPLGELDCILEQLSVPLEFDDEAGQALLESLALCVKPSSLLRIFHFFGDRSQQRIVRQWQRLEKALPLHHTISDEMLLNAAQAYVWVSATELAHTLESSFVEDGNSARSHGDLYIAVNERYYFNFNYLFRDYGLTRKELISLLEQLAARFPLDPEALSALGGEQVFRAVVATNVAFQGEDAPKALAQLLPLVDLDAEQLGERLPPQLMRLLLLSATARQLGFELQARDLLEVYECGAIFKLFASHAAPAPAALRFLDFLLMQAPSDDEQAQLPDQEWQRRWRELMHELGRDTLVAASASLIPVYQHYARMLSSPSSARPQAVWIAASLAEPALSNWVVALSTEQGADSPVIAASLLHESLTPEAFSALCRGWEKRVEAVPVHPTWSRDFTALVLRFAICRQKAWLLDKLVDLYIRGGAYEEGASRAQVASRLSNFIKSIELDENERAELDSSGLRFDLLPLEVNVFTGERIDDSRWASPTAAFKYVRTLLRIAGRSPEQLAGLLSEKRVVGLEKSLRLLDFHASVQQIVACYHALAEDPGAALELFLLLRASEGERVKADWLSRCTALLAPLSIEQSFQLLWELYRCDHADVYSLNPGLFWAMRLCPSADSVLALGKAATDMVRRQPSFAVAALDTLDAISSRPALSAILQMSRRIRNRKVLRLINRTIEHIAKQQGMVREVFLDYSADTGELEADASRVFDFGTHHVTLSIQLDGQLSTLVIDAKGKRLRSFPKTAKDADPTLYRDFQDTKKKLVETLAYQSRRLEAAMIEGRCWGQEDFLDIFLSHPVMSALGKRLVWCAVHPEREGGYFRPLGEGLVNVSGDVFTLPEGASVRLLHPLFIAADERLGWEEQLAAAGIVQPFDQVNRHVFRDPAELEQVCGRVTLGSLLYRLVKERGWSTDGGTTWEPGFETHSCRAFPDHGLSVHVSTGALGEDDRLRISDVYFMRGDEPIEAHEVELIVFSEALRDLVLCMGVA